MLSNAYRFKNKNKKTVLSLTPFNVDNKYFKKIYDDISIIIYKIQNYFKQPKGTLFYDRNIGTNLPQFIFENNSSDIEETIKTNLVEELNYNLTNLYITNIEIEKTLNELNKITYEITISFKDESNLEREFSLIVTENGVKFT